MNIVFLGLPGSGKGTQSKLLANYMHCTLIDLGKIIRNEINLLPEDLRNKMNQGGLLDDDFIIDILKKNISNAEKDYIFDGFPRTLMQSKALFDILNDLHSKIDCIIKLNADEAGVISRLVTRLVCGDCGALIGNDVTYCSVCNSSNFVKRSDDNIASIKKRICEYKKREIEILKFFKDKAIRIVEISSNGTRVEIFQKIMEKIL